MLFLLVGYGEFADLYGAYFEEFAKLGIRVFGYDRKGFGKSKGERGRAGKHIVEECLGFIDLVVKERGYENVRKYVYGVSMGGMLAARITAERPDYFSGLILCVPWFDLHTKITGFKKFAFKIACLVAGNSPIPMPKDMPKEDKEAFDYLDQN